MEYRVSTAQTEMDFELIHGFISNSYWAQGMPPELLRKALGNSLCFGVFNRDNQQLAFARLLLIKPPLPTLPMCLSSNLTVA